VAENYATHKHPKIKAWLERNPRVTMHFTPASGSWMNRIEIFFGIITRQAIRRGTFTSVKELINAVEVFIDGWNERCEPFVWTKTADEILAKAKPIKRLQTRDTRHLSVFGLRARQPSMRRVQRNG
jgi:DDE superfamily endonuclease